MIILKTPLVKWKICQSSAAPRMEASSTAPQEEVQAFSSEATTHPNMGGPTWIVKQGPTRTFWSVLLCTPRIRGTQTQSDESSGSHTQRHRCLSCLAHTHIFPRIAKRGTARQMLEVSESFSSVLNLQELTKSLLITCCLSQLLSHDFFTSIFFCLVPIRISANIL